MWKKKPSQRHTCAVPLATPSPISSFSGLTLNLFLYVRCPSTGGSTEKKTASSRLRRWCRLYPFARRRKVVAAENLPHKCPASCCLYVRRKSQRLDCYGSSRRLIQSERSIERDNWTVWTLTDFRKTATPIHSDPTETLQVFTGDFLCKARDIQFSCLQALYTETESRWVTFHLKILHHSKNATCFHSLYARLPLFQLHLCSLRGGMMHKTLL